ncbi:hypothetical protein RCC89_06330 [Cytophagaceae bacterium ABcell3]|nr:hypothetical protein RCC89_06330 [Cytophagaceae bacterium ABcell3]
MNKDITDNITYPIEIHYESDQVIPLDKLPDRVKVNATGYGWKLLRKSLSFHNGPIVIKPENLPDRNYVTSSQIMPALKQEFGDLRINYLVTDTLYFNFERKASKVIRIKADSVGIPLAAGYRMVSPIAISPDTVSFRGPASVIENLPDTLRVTIPGKNIKDNYSENIRIEHVFNSLVKYEPKEVKVRFNTSLFVQESKQLQVKRLNFPGDTSWIVPDKKVILTYHVKDEHKNKAREEDFRIALNFIKLDLKDSTIVPELVSGPDYISDFYFTPSAVKVKHVKKTS